LYRWGWHSLKGMTKETATNPAMATELATGIRLVKATQWAKAQ